MASPEDAVVKAVGQRLGVLEAAILDAIENLEGDLYLRALGEITAEKFEEGVLTTKESLKRMSGIGL